MNDIFAKWREAVSGGCHPIFGDEVCSGYYRIPSDGVRLERGTNPEQMDQLTSQSWLPVALWIDEDSGQMKGLLDGEDVNPSVIWSLCRQSPVPYDAYRAVAELGHEWPYSVTGTQSSRENGEASNEDLNSISMNRSSFIGDLLLHFTRPYRTRRAVHRSSLRPRLAVCFLLVQAVVYC